MAGRLSRQERGASPGCLGMKERSRSRPKKPRGCKQGFPNFRAEWSVA
jgi:hypothetical protein